MIRLDHNPSAGQLADAVSDAGVDDIVDFVGRFARRWQGWSAEERKEVGEAIVDEMPGKDDSLKKFCEWLGGLAAEGAK